MGVKDNFTADEWGMLLRAPMLVGYAVAGAAPSKRDDFVREMAALADGIAEAERGASTNTQLAAVVVADIIANAEDDRRGQTEKLAAGEVGGRALDACRAVAAVIQTKASPEESYGYKRWLLVVAEKVASAAKEGGLFGCGGEQVSGDEVATINEIGEALEI